MSRSVAEWKGATHDSAIPPRVRLRVWEREKGRCGQCTRVIRAGEPWTLEHVVALINGGANAESNLGVTCSNCLPKKNAADVAEKAYTARVKAKHLGIKKAKHVIPGSKSSQWKKRLDGTVERRK